MSEMSERELFEIWYRKNRVDFVEAYLAVFEGHYVNDITEGAWAGWCAALGQMPQFRGKTRTHNES